MKCLPMWPTMLAKRNMTSSMEQLVINVVKKRPISRLFVVQADVLEVAACSVGYVLETATEKMHEWPLKIQIGGVLLARTSATVRFAETGLGKALQDHSIGLQPKKVFSPFTIIWIR